MITQKMLICLWFDDQAEDAAIFYTSIFKESEIGKISRYGKEGFEFHKKPEGTAMVVSFRLNDLDFMALNGGPQFQFNESISIVVNCETQNEIDYLWRAGKPVWVAERQVRRFLADCSIDITKAVERPEKIGQSSKCIYANEEV